MINREYRTSKASATVIGNQDSLEFTYEDRYLGKITHTFSPAHGKYLTLTDCVQRKDEEIIKYIKENISHAKGFNLWLIFLCCCG